MKLTLEQFIAKREERLDYRRRMFCFEQGIYGPFYGSGGMKVIVEICGAFSIATPDKVAVIEW